LVVGKVVYTAGGDTMSVWLNPDLTIFDGSQVADLTGSHSDLSLASLKFNGNQVDNLTLDDFRLGTTLDAVIPFSTPPASATVAAVNVFYNNSSWDGDAGASANDDLAIATDKAPLLPGQTATFANYTGYSRGLNGLIVDIANLAGTPTAVDFTFKAGNDGSPAGWADAAAPASVSVRAGAGQGGSDRVTLIWADNTIEETWLEVTVKATAQTGLAAPYVFYLGNAPGECGNSAADAMVNAADQLGVRNNPAVGDAAIDNPYDYNRDQSVNAADQLVARNHATSVVTALSLITPP
jgi:hypothetical protein